MTLSTLVFSFHSPAHSLPLLLSLLSATFFSPFSLPSLYLFPSTCCFWVRRWALISWKLQSSSRKSAADEKNLTPQLSTVLIKCAKCSHNYKNLLSEIRCPVVNHERNNDVCISVIICGSRLLQRENDTAWFCLTCWGYYQTQKLH